MREMRRYNSTNSLSMPRDLRLSTASGDDYKHDSMYVSSPDLSQGSHAHTRSSSTDSMEGSYYGNHSRQSSGSTDNYATRRLSSSTRKTSTSTPDPLQFVKLKGAAELAEQAKKQMEVAKEVNLMRGKVDSIGGSEEPDWQSNFNSWRSRRKSAHARVGEDLLDEETEKRPHKTFNQIMAEKEKRRSLGPMSFYPTEDEDQKIDKKEKRRSVGQMNFYPVDDDDSGIGVRSRESPISKSNSQKNESKPKGKASKSTDVAPWAQDSSGEDNSQSDSETNNSHQSGDTDSVFSDKSTPSKVLSDDDSWVKNKPTAQTVSSKLAQPPKTQRSLGDSMKIWENNANESQKSNNKKIRDLPANSAKIKNITQAFEQKDKEANASPVITKRSEFNRSSLSKSLDLTDHSYSKPYTPSEQKPPSPLSPTAPKALIPRDQRFSRGSSSGESPAVNNANKKFTEQTIKINQKPNNHRGFGFFLVGGSEKKQPVTVQRVSLGSAADVCEVEANDELISINGRDVTSLTLAQVQGIVDHSVKRGQIELRIKRYLQEDGYDSMEDNAFNDKASMSNKLDVQTDSSEDTVTYRPALQISTKTEEKPRLMDQLIEERKRETNNNEKHLRAPSPEVTESYQTEITVSTQSAPVYQPIQMNEPIRSQNMSAPDRAWDTSAPDRARERSAPDRAQDMSAPDGAWDKSGPDRAQDMSAPDDVTLTEERSTISVKKSPGSTNLQSDHAPVEMRRSQPPVVQHSPQPPAPPKTELPPLAKHSESPGVTAADDSSGFGPPAALLRWQRPRPKSEYQSSFSSNDNQPSDRTKRFSATLPYKSEHTFTMDKDYSKDDSMMEKVSKDFMESVSVSKPVESKPDSYHFNDSSRIEDWQQKQEQKRKPEQHSSTPPVEFNIHREEHLTAQSAAPARKQAQIDAPNLMEINIPNINEATTTLSPQEKFERDQQRIRMQYEEEKRRAREAEKQKQEQEQQALNSDKFLKNMEAQIIQTKQEAASHNLIDKEPIRSAVTEPRFTSNPVTIKLPSGSQGRQLVIDPRNLEDKSDSILPEYSFKVDLPKTESGPPLRTFNQPEQSPEEILAKEREKIREEEKRKFEEEQQRWKEEKERELREEKESIERERERLQREQEKVEREKALLEQKARQEESLRYQPVSNHVHPSPRSSAGSAGSSLSQSPRSPPPALDPKYRETQSRKVPPPATAPKPERGSAKARLTREDLLAMNRKATPLVRPDTTLETSGEKLDNSLSPTTREPPSKGELHSLNAVPKPKFHNSAAWIKDKDIENHTQNEKPFVIGKRSDMIHQRDYSNPSDHWLVREAEKRRLAEKSDYANIESVTAHAGPTKPSQSSLVSRFRGDIEPPPRSNRYSYPSSYSSDSGLSSTTRPQSSTASSLNQYNRVPEKTVTQFSAKTQPNTYSSNPSLSQTLPQNFSFNANVRNQDGMPTKPPRSLTDDSGPVIAVSGKQKCSHCGEELGFGAAMVIESLGLYYHVQCFRCCVCHTPLGNGSEGTDVRVRVNKLHCKNCYSNDEAGLKFSKV